MPCLQCEDNLWKFGETGKCQYESKSQCDESNADYYNDVNYDHSFHFTHEMMEDLHDDGELIVLVEKELKEINNKYKKNI